MLHLRRAATRLVTALASLAIPIPITHTASLAMRTLCIVLTIQFSENGPKKFLGKGKKKEKGRYDVRRPNHSDARDGHQPLDDAVVARFLAQSLGRPAMQLEHRVELRAHRLRQRPMLRSSRSSHFCRRCGS